MAQFVLDKLENNIRKLILLKDFSQLQHHVDFAWLEHPAKSLLFSCRFTFFGAYDTEAGMGVEIGVGDSGDGMHSWAKVRSMCNILTHSMPYNCKTALLVSGLTLALWTIWQTCSKPAHIVCKRLAYSSFQLMHMTHDHAVWVEQAVAARGKPKVITALTASPPGWIPAPVHYSISLCGP